VGGEREERKGKGLRTKYPIDILTIVSKAPGLSSGVKGAAGLAAWLPIRRELREKTQQAALGNAPQRSPTGENFSARGGRAVEKNTVAAPSRAKKHVERGHFF
jgi:hypothetical protein